MIQTILNVAILVCIIAAIVFHFLSKRTEKQIEESKNNENDR